MREAVSNGCSRLIVLALAGLAILWCPISIWMGSAIATILSPDTYKIALASQNIYAELVPAALTSFAQSEIQDNREPGVEPLSAIVKALDPDELRAITSDLIPPQWLRARTEQAVDTAFGWLNSDRTYLGSTFDLHELSERLSGEEGRQAASAIVQAASPCSPEQINAMRAWHQGELDTPPICQPPPLLVPPLTTWLEGFLDEIAGVLENNQVSLAQLVGGQAGIALRNLRLQIAILQQLISLLYLLAAALQALIVTIRVRSLHSFGRWVGWTGIVSGLVALMPLLIVPLATLDSLLGLSSNLRSNPLQTSLTAGFYYSILTQFGGPVLLQAAVLLVAGFLLVASSILVRPPTATESGAVPAAGARRTVSIPAVTQKKDS
jgi:hypothetical protein